MHATRMCWWWLLLLLSWGALTESAWMFTFRWIYWAFLWRRRIWKVQQWPEVTCKPRLRRVFLSPQIINVDLRGCEEQSKWRTKCNRVHIYFLKLKPCVSPLRYCSHWLLFFYGREESSPTSAPGAEPWPQSEFCHFTFYSFYFSLILQAQMRSWRLLENWQVSVKGWPEMTQKKPSRSSSPVNG